MAKVFRFNQSHNSRRHKNGGVVRHNTSRFRRTKNPFRTCGAVGLNRTIKNEFQKEKKKKCCNERTEIGGSNSKICSCADPWDIFRELKKQKRDTGRWRRISRIFFFLCFKKKRLFKWRWWSRRHFFRRAGERVWNFKLRPLRKDYNKQSRWIVEMNGIALFSCPPTSRETIFFSYSPSANYELKSFFFFFVVV